MQIFASTIYIDYILAFSPSYSSSGLAMCWVIKPMDESFNYIYIDFQNAYLDGSDCYSTYLKIHNNYDTTGKLFP